MVVGGGGEGKWLVVASTLFYRLGAGRQRRYTIFIIFPRSDRNTHSHTLISSNGSKEKAIVFARAKGLDDEWETACNALDSCAEVSYSRAFNIIIIATTAATATARQREKGEKGIC